MIDIDRNGRYGNGRRRAFSIWLRTGHVPAAPAVERKFNPWHDADDGRFTFADGGRYFAAGGGGSAVPMPRSRTVAPGRTPSPRGGWAGGGFTGGGGGSAGGGGASGRWDAPQRPTTRPQVAAGAHPRAAAPVPTATTERTARVKPPGLHAATRRIGTPIPADERRTILRNGYSFDVDRLERNRQSYGEVVLAGVPIRSRTEQARAGGRDRRPDDDGGHYIAARFNGPAEAFNHFAQNSSFNRGGYRALEDSWAKATRTGHRVVVQIVPSYDGTSLRPSRIQVWYTIDGSSRYRQFDNVKPEPRRGR